MLKENDIQKSVLEKIHTGNISMRSRIFFTIRSISIGTLSLLILAASLFILSFVFFSVRESGIRYLLEFGERGIGAFIALFPWLTLLLVFLLLVALEILLRNFTFGYRFPLLRIFLWILVTGVVGSILIGFTPLHSFLLSEADNDQLPLIGSWYEQIHDSHHEQGIYRGEVSSTTPTWFIISHNDIDRDSDEGSWNIIPPAGFDLSTLHIGQSVYVAGRLRNGVVYAYGIQLNPYHE